MQLTTVFSRTWPVAPPHSIVDAVVARPMTARFSGPAAGNRDVPSASDPRTLKGVPGTSGALRIDFICSPPLMLLGPLRYAVGGSTIGEAKSDANPFTTEVSSRTVYVHVTVSFLRTIPFVCDKSPKHTIVVAVVGVPNTSNESSPGVMVASEDVSVTSTEKFAPLVLGAVAVNVKLPLAPDEGDRAGTDGDPPTTATAKSAGGAVVSPLTFRTLIEHVTT
jgi:hypothetical protein